MQLNRKVKGLRIAQKALEQFPEFANIIRKLNNKYK